MLGEFSILSQGVEEALRELEGFLWREDWEGEADILKRRLVEVCEQWDSFLGAGGVLAETVEAAVQSLDRGPKGQELYSFLTQIYELSAALEALRSQDWGGAVRRAARTAEATAFGLSLHLGLADSFMKYRKGELARGRWLEGLMKALREAGSSSGRRWRRLLEEVLWVKGFLEEVEGEEMQLAYAKHAVCTAGILLHTHLQVLKELGQYMDVPHQACEKLVPLLCSRC
jgi:hypothetical protein